MKPLKNASFVAGLALASLTRLVATRATWPAEARAALCCAMAVLLAVGAALSYTLWSGEDVLRCVILGCVRDTDDGGGAAAPATAPSPMPTPVLGRDAYPVSGFVVSYGVVGFLLCLGGALGELVLAATLLARGRSAKRRGAAAALGHVPVRRDEEDDQDVLSRSDATTPTRAVASPKQRVAAALSLALVVLPLLFFASVELPNT